MTDSASSQSPLRTFLITAIWLGTMTGLVEGFGLLVFQHINWERWGPMMHVSAEIFWISPIVDVLFFVVLALIARLFAAIWPATQVDRGLMYVLIYLAAYDWLTLTSRISHRACIILALGISAAVNRWASERELAVFFRKTVVWVLAAFCLVFMGIQGGSRLKESMAVGQLPAPVPGSPNVLVIVVDTLRADHVSSYGCNRPTTPEIDRLAREGTLFENAVATSSWSLPSHASLITGRYPFEHRLQAVEREPWLGWGNTSLAALPTAGEAVQKLGYRTGAFSANRTYFSADLGFGRGFLHFEDYFHSPADMFVRTLFGREFARIYLKRTDHSLPKRILRGLRLYSLLDQDAEGSGSFGGAFGIRKRADVVNREVLDWIDRDTRHPFFAFLNYFDVHDPYGGPRWGWQPRWPQGTEIDQYDNGASYVDEQIASLMQALQQRGLDKNLLVIVTSDHGEALGQHGQEKHGGALYWEQIRVPLIFWYPGHVPAAVRITPPLSNATIASTTMALLGGENPFPGSSIDAMSKAGANGEAFLPALSELAQNKYVAKLELNPGRYGPTALTGDMRSLVAGPWHLIQFKGETNQLYNWTNDPGEMSNQLGTPAGRSTSSEIESELKQLYQRPPSANAPPGQRAAPPQ